jgi:hypothetical protein
LLNEQVGIIARSERVGFKNIFVLTYHVERLGAN